MVRENVKTGETRKGECNYKRGINCERRTNLPLQIFVSDSESSRFTIEIQNRDSGTENESTCIANSHDSNERDAKRETNERKRCNPRKTNHV